MPQIYNTTHTLFNCGERFAECSSGLIIPLINECTWKLEVRATLYLIALLYCFLGVAIIADIFMGAIEKITSKTRKIYIAGDKDDEPIEYEVRLWSDTVANLTLMALGSSAPEILLSIIEIIANNFEAGALGPGTIVGSAAFNLFVIIAVCIMAIPNGESRRINDIKVFAVTAFFSVLAYLWLLIILVGSSPGVVDLWEAAITFALFPILVVIAWLVEKNVCGLPSTKVTSKQIELGSFQPGERDTLVKGRDFFQDGKLDRDSLVSFIKEVKKYPGLTDEDAAVLAATKLVESQPHSRMWYRVGAVRSITGGRKTVPQISFKLKQVTKEIESILELGEVSKKIAFKAKRGKKDLISLEDGTTQKIDKTVVEVYSAMNEHPDAPTLGDVPKVQPHENAIIDFHSASCAVMENIGKFPILICRNGRTDNRVKVRVESIDGTAVVDEDYIKVDEVIVFEPEETEKEIMVEIVNDNQWEPDEEFFLKLSLLYGSEEDRSNVQLGRVSIMDITILNDDEPGVVMFSKRGFIVKESIGDAVVTVTRKNGADGEISVKWRTIDKSAVNGKDFLGGEGVLVFKHTETERDIIIPIINDMKPEKDEHFEIEIFDPTGGATVGQVSKTAITIINDDNFEGVLSRMMHLTNVNLDKIQVHHETYMSQIMDALNVNGGDIGNATTSDYILHFCTFGWKVMFALVPPPSIAGGWLCFFVSLGAIGILTAIISDLASLFGCLVGLDDQITAITLVALGTSLPDTFASRTAAIQEKYADSAVGNVTGSNSVNVFLGLGLPWLMAAIYHAVKGSKFEVATGGLGFSVGVFTGLCVLCIALLLVRRYAAFAGKAELGGPAGAKYGSGIFLVFLWILYILFSVLKTYNVI